MIDVYLRENDQMRGALIGSFDVQDLDTLVESVKKHQTAVSSGEDTFDDAKWITTAQYVVDELHDKTRFEIIVEYLPLS